MGVNPRELHGLSAQYGGILFMLYQTTVAGTASYRIPDVNGLVHVTPLIVIGFGGIMTGNGGVGDTIQLQDSGGNAISEAIDVSALLTGDIFACSTITMQNAILAKNEGLLVVTASGATALCFANCLRYTP